MFASESLNYEGIGYEDAMTFPRRLYELFMTLLVQAVPDLLV